MGKGKEPQESRTSEDQPPPFSEYKASTSKQGTSIGSDDIVTHDRHVNADGEALYRFILGELRHIPILHIMIYGTTYDNRTGTYMNNTDFCFFVEVPVPSVFANQGVQWSLSDGTPAYRGRSSREIEANGIKGKVRSNDKNDYIEQRNAGRALGAPSWAVDIGESNLHRFLHGEDAASIEYRRSLEQTAWKSSKSLREWADEYCADSKSVKEFTFQQETYGWNFAELKETIYSAIVDNGYYGCLSVYVWSRYGRIHVRPPTVASKILSRIWHAGGVWKTCGISYPLLGWVDAAGDEPGAVKTASGFKKRAGVSEKDWWAQYKDTVLEAVKDERWDDTPVVCPIPE